MALMWLSCAILAPGVFGDGTEPEIHLADGRRPPVLDTFSVPDRVQALAVTPDGRRAAVALILAIDKRDVSSEIRVYDMDRAEPVNVPVSGFVRDLLYLEGSSGLFGIEHHPAKRHEGDSYLVSSWARPPHCC
jgi:hypothetical protein